MFYSTSGIFFWDGWHKTSIVCNARRLPIGSWRFCRFFFSLLLCLMLSFTCFPSFTGSSTEKMKSFCSSAGFDHGGSVPIAAVSVSSCVIPTFFHLVDSQSSQRDCFSFQVTSDVGFSKRVLLHIMRGAARRFEGLRSFYYRQSYRGICV